MSLVAEDSNHAPTDNLKKTGTKHLYISRNRYDQTI